MFERSAGAAGASPKRVKLDPSEPGLVTAPGLSATDILEALPFYVMLVDDRHHILEANAAVRSQLGLDPEAIIGQYCPKVIHGLDEPWHACPLEEAVQTGEPVEREAFDERAGCWVRSAVYPLESPTAHGGRLYFHTVSDISDRKKAEEELLASREQLRDLSRHLESAREEERTRMARQIHDELAQSLTALKFDVAWLQTHVPVAVDGIAERTVSIGQSIDEAIEIVQRLSAELRPSLLDDLGLVDALQWQVQEFGRRTGIDAKFSASPPTLCLDPHRSTSLFRICQEALTNVARHAEATSVIVSVRKYPGRVELKVRDDGIGIRESHTTNRRSFGLIGMRERAGAWGGDVKIARRQGRGTCVTAAVPTEAVGS